MEDDLDISFEEQIAAGDALVGEHLFPHAPSPDMEGVPEDDELDTEESDV